MAAVTCPRSWSSIRRATSRPAFSPHRRPYMTGDGVFEALTVRGWPTPPRATERRTTPELDAARILAVRGLAGARGRTAGARRAGGVDGAQPPLRLILYDLHAMLKDEGDWVPLGNVGRAEGGQGGHMLEPWARAADNPVGGWTAWKGLRAGSGSYVPPVMEVLGLAEVEHGARNNRMRRTPRHVHPSAVSRQPLAVSLWPSASLRPSGFGRQALAVSLRRQPVCGEPSVLTRTVASSNGRRATLAPGRPRRGADRPTPRRSRPAPRR